MNSQVKVRLPKLELKPFKPFVWLPKIKSANDICGLRKLFYKVESSVRKLKTLSVEPDTYGSLLVPFTIV